MLAALAAAAGLVGCFAVMRRMTLVADALSHVALPGLGAALLFHLFPLAGAVAALLGGTVLIWALETRSGLATETIVGVVFSVSLAVGALLTSGEALIEALFGGPQPPTPSELAFGLLGAAAVAAVTLKLKNALVVSLVSPELALTSGVNVPLLNLGYLAAFALTVALGLHYLGVLLMGSLIIIPAATARRLARNLTQMFAFSTSAAVLSALSGAYAASWFRLETGPFIVAASGLLFFLSLLKKR